MSLRGLGRNALSSVAQVVLSALVLFELYRFLTRQLRVDEIGLWSLVLATTAPARFAELGLSAGVVKFVAADMAAGDSRLAVRTVGMAAGAVAIIAALACILLYPSLQAVLLRALPEQVVGTAIALLPFALIALITTTVGNIFIGALDGRQRFDLRAMVQVGAALLQLGSAYVLVPKYGVEALGWVQVIQSAGLLVGALALALVEFRQSGAAWIGWERKRARELMRYGAGTQFGVLGQLLFEPMVKVLLAVFGGLALTGYYEMANRMMLQFRAVIVAAYRVLVPYVAERMLGRAASAGQIGGMYLKPYRLLVVLATPYYALLGVALPIILTLWLGRFDERFTAVGLVCWLGWSLNTINVPAYFFYLAIGRLRWILGSQFVIGALNLVLAMIGGWMWGGYGVLAGATIALVAGSVVLVAAFHIEHGITAREFFPPQTLPVVVVSILGVVVGLVGAWSLRGMEEWIALLGVYALVLAGGMVILAWRHPLVTDLVVRIRFDTPRGHGGTTAE